jgi:SepF-like predicted cell division protein (DUF552 family)
MDLVTFKPNSATLDPSSQDELKRLVRLAKANPQLKFEIQVMLSGYEEDSIKSGPDLTEMLVDSIRTKYDDIDSLGQLYQRDTVMAKVTYHNDRTQKQSEAIIDYLASQGADRTGFTTFVNAIPAVTPENRKLTIKAVARKR